MGLSCCQRVFWHLCCPLSWSHTYLSARTSRPHYGRLSSRNLSLLQAKTAYQCCAQTGTASCCYNGIYNGEEQMRAFSAGSTNVGCPFGFRMAINLLIVAQKGGIIGRPAPAYGGCPVAICCCKFCNCCHQGFWTSSASYSIPPYQSVPDDWLSSCNYSRGTCLPYRLAWHHPSRTCLLAVQQLQLLVAASAPSPVTIDLLTQASTA